MYVAGGWQTTALHAMRWFGVGGEVVHDSACPMREERPSFPRKRESIFIFQTNICPQQVLAANVPPSGGQAPALQGAVSFPSPDASAVLSGSVGLQPASLQPSFPQKQGAPVIPAKAGIHPLFHPTALPSQKEPSRNSQSTCAASKHRPVRRNPTGLTFSIELHHPVTPAIIQITDYPQFI